MTIEKIQQIQEDVEKSEREAVALKKKLSLAVAYYLSDFPVREAARAMKISASYVSDLRLGRRQISEAVISKLGALGAAPAGASDVKK